MLLSAQNLCNFEKGTTKWIVFLLIFLMKGEMMLHFTVFKKLYIFCQVHENYHLNV